MKTRSSHPSHGFTLLEMIVVLALCALVLTAVYSISQGTLTLADELRRAQNRDTRRQALVMFCERLFRNLPASASLNVSTTQEHGQHLMTLELQNVPSPFDGSPKCLLRMNSETLAGGGMRLRLACHPSGAPQPRIESVLLDDLTLCEWRVLDPSGQRWTSVWSEDAKPESHHSHPLLISLRLRQGMDDHTFHFWIAPGMAPQS